MEEYRLQEQPPVFNEPRRPQPPMDVVTAVKKVLTTPGDYAGRSRRSEFWWFTGFYYVVSQIVAMVAQAAFGLKVGAGAQIAVLAALTVPMMAVQVRRLHDTGRSSMLAWLFLAANIGMYGSIIALGDVIWQLAANPFDHSLAQSVTTGLLKNHGTAMSVLVTSSLGYIVFGLILLIFNLIDSEPGNNEYGPSPKYQ